MPKTFRAEPVMKFEEGTRNYLSAILETLPEAITVHSADGVIVCANSAAGSLASAPTTSLIGKPCEQVFHEGAFDCPHVTAVADRSSVRARHLIQQTGHEYEVTVTPIVDTADLITGYVRVVSDITEKRRSHNQLVSAERLGMIGQMLAGIAHDAGTPLNIISGYCEYLLMKSAPGSEGYKELSTILEQTRRVGVLMRQMLELAVPAERRKDAIGVHGFLTESLNLMGHHLRKKGIRVEVSCSGTPPLVYGDAPRLRQAFFSLLMTASQTIESGSMIQVLIDQPGDRSNAVRILFAGKNGDGVPQDFSFLCRELLRDEMEMGTPGLSHVREVFNDFRAEIDRSELAESASALVLILPTGVSSVGAG